jgi:beta-glucosidase
VIFPHNIGLGCARNPSLVERAARVTAAEVRATGINWTFAPCVTVPRDERWGRTYEGFGETPELARDLGAAAVRGFQGSDLRDPLSIVACAKHFMGDGGTSFGTGPKNKLLDRGDTKNRRTPAQVNSHAGLCHRNQSWRRAQSCRHTTAGMVLSVQEANDC